MISQEGLDALIAMTPVASKVPADAVYALEEFTGRQDGNYRMPGNFRLPNLCDDCPLKDKISCPQISQGAIEHFNIGPKNPRSIFDMAYITNLAGTETGVLLLSDTADDTIEPFVLQEMEYFTSPFSVEHENPVSQALGWAHERFDHCEGPKDQANFLQRLLGKIIIKCGTGTVNVSQYNFNQLRAVRGAKVVYDSEELQANPIEIN